MSLATPERIRSLQRKLYCKAKAKPAFRFYTLYDKICRADILAHAYEAACTNAGAPGEYYGPVRLPPRPSRLATSRPLPSPTTGLPRLPASPFQRAVPITPANRTGAFVDYFPVHAAFPAFWPGRHPHYGFRGLLRFHSRYGPLDCSTARSGLCHEASARSVARPGRSSATRSIDNSLGGTLLRW